MNTPASQIRIAIFTAVAALVLGGSAAAALADGISVTGPGTASAGQKVTFTVQGEASSEGSAPYEVRALFGTDACVPDFLQLFASNLVSLSGGEPLLKTTGGPFSQDVGATAPAGGTYNVCAYLISTNHPVAVTLAKGSTTVVVAGGSAKTKPPSRATLLRRALAKCKKIKKAKKRAACTKAARKRYGPKR